MNYSILTKYRSGEEEGTNQPWNKSYDCGGFRSTVDFTIIKHGGSRSKKGIIVQYIKKSTVVDVYNKDGGGLITTLNTSKMIYDYTNENVPYMNDSYLEYFEVSSQGQSIYGDQFGNGPICEYDNLGPIIDDALDIGHGKITQTGYAIFIPYPFSATIRQQYKWNNDKSLPANGLYSIPFDIEIWGKIFESRQSNVYIHSISYEWRYLNIFEQNRSASYIDFCKENPHIINVNNMEVGIISAGGTAKNKTKKSSKYTHSIRISKNKTKCS